MPPESGRKIGAQPTMEFNREELLFPLEESLALSPKMSARVMRKC